MAYFTEEYLQFFKELAPNNHREWFHENKKRYETHVKSPFEKFVGHMIMRLSDFDDELKTLHPKDCIFRINKDVRFSKDKSPYKLQMSAIIAKGGRKGMVNPGVYIELTPEKLGIYSGVYMPEKDQLLHIRNHIAANQKKFQKLITDPHYLKYFPEGIQGEKNKILPAELKEAAAQETYIFNKQFYWHVKLDPETILVNNLDEIVIEHYLASKNLANFFKDALV
jgi:uncharacterized protein (TIGR02453 family)